MKQNNIFYGWWIVLGSAVILAVLGPASVAVANIFQTPVTAEFGISNSQFAISNSLVLGVGIFLSPYISQKLAGKNFRLVFLIGIFAYVLAYAGYGLAPNMYVFYLLSLFVGFGYMTTTIIPVSMMVNNWFIQKRGLALSLALSGLGIGGVVFSQLLTWLIGNVGWRQTYMIYGALMFLVATPIVWFIFKASPEDMNLTALGASKLNQQEQQEEGQQEQSQGVSLPVTETMAKPFFILLVVGSVIVGIISNGGLGQFPPVLYGMHGPAVGATIISVYSGVGIIGKIVLGNINDRYGTVVSTIYAAILMVMTYLAMMFAGNIILAFMMAVLFGMGNAVGTVAPPLITSAIYSSKNYPKAYGYVQSGVQLGLTFGSLFAAAIADFTGSYNFAWGTLSILSAILAVSWIGAYRNAQKYIQRPKR